MLEAVANIERYVDRGRQALERDELLQTWFLRQFQIIGEAANALPEAVRALAPGVPWTKIVGMRNVLVHGYFDIDTDKSGTRWQGTCQRYGRLSRRCWLTSKEGFSHRGGSSTTRYI